MRRNTKRSPRRKRTGLGWNAVAVSAFLYTLALFVPVLLVK